MPLIESRPLTAFFTSRIASGLIGFPLTISASGVELLVTSAKFCGLVFARFRPLANSASRTPCDMTATPQESTQEAGQSIDHPRAGRLYRSHRVMKPIRPD